MSGMAVVGTLMLNIYCVSKIGRAREISMPTSQPDSHPSIHPAVSSG